MAPHSSTPDWKIPWMEGLMGCSPWGRKESDTTERLHFHFSLSCTGEGNGNPLQCSCLENPRHGGAWWAAIYGIAQSQTGLKWLSSLAAASFSNILPIESLEWQEMEYMLKKLLQKQYISKEYSLWTSAEKKMTQVKTGIFTSSLSLDELFGTQIPTVIQDPGVFGSRCTFLEKSQASVTYSDASQLIVHVLQWRCAFFLSMHLKA